MSLNTSLGNKQKIGKGIVFGLFLCGIAAFFYFDLGQWLSLEQLKAHRETLQRTAHVYGVWAILAYIALYIVQTAISIPGATIFTLAGGFLFGSLWGTVYANIGATLGAALAFLSARYLARNTLEKRMGRWLTTMGQGFARHPFRFVLILRLTAIFPFFLLNLTLGLTPIRLLPYMLATSLGILPASFVIAHAGQQLGSLNSIGEIVSPKILAAFILLGLLALAPVIYKRFRPLERTFQNLPEPPAPSHTDAPPQI